MRCFNESAGILRPAIAFIALVAIALVAPSIARANMMPFAWGIEMQETVVIPVVLILEWLVLRWLFDFTWGRAFGATVTVNVVSYLVGALLLTPVGHVLYGSDFDSLMFYFMAAGSSLSVLFFALVLTLTDVGIEITVLKFSWEQKITPKRLGAWFVVNAITVLLVLGSLGMLTRLLVPPWQLIGPSELVCLEQSYTDEIRYLRGLASGANRKKLADGLTFDSDWLETTALALNEFPRVVELRLTDGTAEAQFNHPSADDPRVRSDIDDRHRFFDSGDIRLDRHGKPNSGLVYYTLKWKPFYRQDTYIHGVTGIDPECSR